MTDQPFRILLIDNFDSFTFNLVHMLEENPACTLTVMRNDDDFLPLVARGDFDGAIIGPGPGSAEDPRYFGRNADLILTHGGRGLPILGVCLGFQGIFHVFGGRLKQAAMPVHGKTSRLDLRAADPVLDGIPQGAQVMRYHSILADTDAGIPDVIDATSYTLPDPDFAANGAELMSLRHRSLPIFGVQFHPESFGTHFGRRMVDNFCQIVTHAAVRD
ncbi:anthranilate synthase component II [Thalassococcus sp. BH17M4-6]|uniref:anthranilate synthase component II n=1 Tax=Thalassococcus sp. BH17M4-6 TaxID=3413148 RepID=UPI003BE1D32F